MNDARCSNALTRNRVFLQELTEQGLQGLQNYYKTEKMTDRVTPREFELAELTRCGSAC